LAYTYTYTYKYKFIAMLNWHTHTHKVQVHIIGEKCERKQPNINLTEFSGISEKSPKLQKPIFQNLRGF